MSLGTAIAISIDQSAGSAESEVFPLTTFSGEYYDTLPAADAWVASDSPGFTLVVEFRVPALPASGYWTIFGVGASAGSPHSRVFLRLNSTGTLSVVCNPQGTATTYTIDSSGSTVFPEIVPNIKYTVHLCWDDTQPDQNRMSGVSPPRLSDTHDENTALPVEYEVDFTYDVNEHQNIAISFGGVLPDAKGINWEPVSSARVRIISHVGLAPFTGLTLYQRPSQHKCWINGVPKMIFKDGIDLPSALLWGWSETTPGVLNGGRRGTIGIEKLGMAGGSFTASTRMGYIDGGAGDVACEIGLVFFSTAQIDNPALFYGGSPDLQPLIDAGIHQVIMGHSANYDPEPEGIYGPGKFAAGWNDGTGNFFQGFPMNHAFNALTDGLTKATAPTGFVDGRYFTLAFKIVPWDIQAADGYVWIDNNTSSCIRFLGTSGNLRVNLTTYGGITFDVSPGLSPWVEQTWQIAIDNVGGTAQVWLNGVSVYNNVATGTSTNLTMGTMTNSSICCSSTFTNSLYGSVGFFWMSQGATLGDHFITDTTKFYSASSDVALSTNGTGTGLTQPKIFFGGLNTAAHWVAGINAGSGGDTYTTQGSFD